jgi:hypothetical protein
LLDAARDVSVMPSSALIVAELSYSSSFIFALSGGRPPEAGMIPFATTIALPPGTLCIGSPFSSTLISVFNSLFIFAASSIVKLFEAAGLGPLFSTLIGGFISFVFPPALFVRRPPAGEFLPEDVLLF